MSDASADKAQLDWRPIEVGAWRRIASATEEPMGTKEKWWLEDADKRRWLLKYPREDDKQGVRGEDWAEVLAHRLAGLIGVPTAEVEPATCDGRRAIISRSMNDRNAGEDLVHGNELLAGSIKDYGESIRRENPDYTVSNVKRVFDERSVGSPAGESEMSDFSGFDVWAGYLMMDAWVAGRDRHHENWAVIATGGELRLAPSFDHGNALGFQVSDSEALAMVENDLRFSKWVEKGESHHFFGRPKLVDLAREALALASAQAREFWLQRLTNVEREKVCQVVNVVPDSMMSDSKRKFVNQLLEINRRRILDGYSRA